jgi:hypothetical protein
MAGFDGEIPALARRRDPDSRGDLQELMLLIFGMRIFTYLSREPMRRLVWGVPPSVSFIGSGLCFGLLTEVFAILKNRHLPPEQRILLSGTVSMFLSPVTFAKAFR